MPHEAVLDRDSVAATLGIDSGRLRQGLPYGVPFRALVDPAAARHWIEKMEENLRVSYASIDRDVRQGIRTPNWAYDATNSINVLRNFKNAFKVRLFDGDPGPSEAFPIPGFNWDVVPIGAFRTRAPITAPPPLVQESRAAAAVERVMEAPARAHEASLAGTERSGGSLLFVLLLAVGVAVALLILGGS